MQNKFHTIDGATLMSRPLVPIPFVVQSLISTGLHILAGAPKVGKSWLALWLCLQVAKGESVWNFATERKTTLYLCLEDSEARIQNRLFDVTDDAPDNVHFTVTSNSIGDGLERQIESFVSEHPDTGFIVIDTLQKIRRVTNDNAYANDYRDLGVIKEIADRLGIAILLIHHLRKQKDDDPMNMVSGTTGITGAVDSSFVLEKDRRSGDRATLYCSGRDIEYRELQLEFDNVAHLWELISDSVENPEQLLDNTISLVCGYLREHISFTGRPSELAEKLSILSGEKINPNVLSKKLLQSQNELAELGIMYRSYRSNGNRYIELKSVGSADSADKNDISPYPENVDPVDPAVTAYGKNPPCDRAVAPVCAFTGRGEVYAQADPQNAALRACGRSPENLATP